MGLKKPNRYSHLVIKSRILLEDKRKITFKKFDIKEVDMTTFINLDSSNVNTGRFRWRLSDGVRPASHLGFFICNWSINQAKNIQGYFFLSSKISKFFLEFL